MIGNNFQYYGLSDSGYDGPQVTIPDSNNGSKIINMTIILNPKKEQKKLYEINQLSAYVSNILNNLAGDTNNKHLIVKYTITRCQ